MRQPRGSPSGKLIDLYLRRRVVGRLRTAKSIESRLRRTLAPILQRYAADICRRDMRAILDSIVDQGKGREAEKRRQVCTAMFRWALSQDIVEADPTAGLTPYDRGAPRDRVLTLEEIELVWKWLDTDALSLEAADILKLELLTGARCGEISGLRAEEIDRQKWTWTLPRCALEKWASARHADCGPRARDARTTAIWCREGTPLPAGEGRGRDLGPYRPLSVDAPDNIADRRIHLA